MNLKSTQSNFRSQRGQLPPVIVAGLLIVVVLGLLLYNSFFVVKQWEQAVLVQFGEIQGDPIVEPGLKFKRPFIQNVTTYEKRLLRLDGDVITAFTRDRRSILINVTARWRITEADKFLQRVNTVNTANNRLNGIIESAVRNVIASYDLHEVVRSSNQILESSAVTATTDPTLAEEDIELDFLDDLATLGRVLPELQIFNGQVRGRTTVLNEILEQARRDLVSLDFGIEIEDILIRQLNYTQDIEANVYLQMNAELAKISAGYRSIGNERAQRKLGEMERELASIRSNGERQAAEIRGEAEAEAIKIFAEAYQKDEEFFRFLRTLRSYEKIIGKNSTLVLGTDSDIYSLLKVYSKE